MTSSLPRNAGEEGGGGGGGGGGGSACWCLLAVTDHRPEKRRDNKRKESIVYFVRALQFDVLAHILLFTNMHLLQYSTIHVHLL